ncbi:MAG: BatD family protein [Bdellovibrionota bacterium]
MTKIGNFFLFFTFLFSSLTQAQVVLRATVEQEEVALGEPFEVVVSVVSKKAADVGEPRIPNLDGFELKGQSSSSKSSYNMMQTPTGMDWQSQTQYDYKYVFVANRLGQLSIGSFEVVIDGQQQTTQPLLIKVVKEGRRQNPRNQRPQGGGGMIPGFEDPFEALDRQEEEMFNQLLQRRQNNFRQQEPQYKSLPTNPNEAFFVQVEVDKTEVFEGEQITANWYLYTRGQIETLDRVKFPDLRGFWKEIIEEVPSIQFYEEVVNGIPYRKALLASHALFPIKAGNLVVDEFKIKSKVRLARQGSVFGLGPAYEFTKSSKPVKIKVNPLPTEGRPSSFSGAVGQFRVSAKAEKSQVPVNQPFSLKVRFEGSGNAKGIELPGISWPNGLEIYDTKSESKFFKNGLSFKEFEILIIPRQEGEMTIPAIDVSVFDPIQKKYLTQKTTAIPIKVVNNPNGQAGATEKIPGVVAEKEVKTKPGLPPIVKTWDVGSHANLLKSPEIGWGMYIVYLVFLLMKARTEFGWGLRKRNLNDILRKKFKTLESSLKNNDYRKIGIGMTNLFYTTLGEISEQGGGSHEIEKLLEKCPPSLRNEYGPLILKKFEIFQTLGFAPDEALKTFMNQKVLQQETATTQKLLLTLVDTYLNQDKK